MSARTGEHVELDDRIVDATFAILRERGPAAVTIEAVTAATGIAKTTIYRRYADRDALVEAAIARATIDVDLPDGLSLYDTLSLLLTEARVRVQDVVGRGTVVSILLEDDAPHRDELRRMIRARVHGLVEQLRARVDSGELRADLDVKLAISVLFGAAVGQIIRGSEPDDAWAEKLLVLMWPSLTGHDLTDADRGSSPG